MKALRLLVPAILLAVLWHWLDGPAIAERLAATDPVWLAAACAASALQTVLLALRWRLTAGALGHEIRLSTALREYFVAQLVNQTLPGGMLGDAARAVRTKGEAGLAVSGQAVVIERLTGQVALLIVTLCGLALASALPGGVRWPAWTEIIPLWLAGIGFALAVAVLGLRRFRPGWIALMVEPVRRAVLAREVWPRQAVLGLAVVGLNLLTFAFSARAVGVVMPVEAVVTLVPLVMTAMLVPISIAGWGFREGAALALLPLGGITPETAVAASIVFGAVILCASLPGAFWLSHRPRA
ncbi:lysylphosphatidylglycerol synthase transmembrane domain-containing protein [Frigidibacter oleivorans]|uniref:lysylphosphatidylglycerol synthase transmembrane domain-containing protein n=1 Tax=Frigidibacter oleivorans TaxID=2487129 RepID=UPI000F8DB800|nr:lysylphosphatidylglycerol synthase transmembrane domain-containing protein [Frigidibacter oleivorans]